MGSAKSTKHVNRIFISHSKDNKDQAKALVTFLSGIFGHGIPITCTSVPGRDIDGGKNIPDALKEYVNDSNVVWGLISRESLTSSWVMFELAAAWFASKLLIPVLFPGLSPTDLPKPIDPTSAIICDEDGLKERFLGSTKLMAEAFGVTFDPIIAMGPLEELLTVFKAYQEPEAPPALSMQPYDAEIEALAKTMEANIQINFKITHEKTSSEPTTTKSAYSSTLRDLFLAICCSETTGEDKWSGADILTTLKGNAFQKFGIEQESFPGSKPSFHVVIENNSLKGLRDLFVEWGLFSLEELPWVQGDYSWKLGDKGKRLLRKYQQEALLLLQHSRRE